MRLIGHRWKYGNVCRLMILIGRGLDLKNCGYKEEKRNEEIECLTCGQDIFLCSFEGAESTEQDNISGDYSLRDPPVPIPNTEVKPQHADSTWLETAREGRSSPDSNKSFVKTKLFSFCTFGWYNEHMAGKATKNM